LIECLQDDNTFLGLDIGLIKLEDGMMYSAISFDNKEVDGTNLNGFTNFENLSIGEILSMDTFYNGWCEGILGWRGVHLIDLEYL